MENWYIIVILAALLVILVAVAFALWCLSRRQTAAQTPMSPKRDAEIPHNQAEDRLRTDYGNTQASRLLPGYFHPNALHQVRHPSDFELYRETMEVALQSRNHSR